MGFRNIWNFFTASSRPSPISEADLEMEKHLKMYRHKYDVLNRWSSRKNSALLYDPGRIEKFLVSVNREMNTFKGLFEPERAHLSKHLVADGEELLKDYQELIKSKEMVMAQAKKAA